MLSLFKLPFWKNTSCTEERFPAQGIAQGIFKNYLTRKMTKDDDSLGEVEQHIEYELDALQRAVQQTSREESYEMILASLRRIDKQLDEF